MDSDSDSDQASTIGTSSSTTTTTSTAANAMDIDMADDDDDVSSSSSSTSTAMWTILPIELRLYVLDFLSFNMRPLVHQLAALDDAVSSSSSSSSSAHRAAPENAFTRSFRLEAAIQMGGLCPHSPHLNERQMSLLCATLFGRFDGDPSGRAVYWLWRNVDLRGGVGTTVPIPMPMGGPTVNKFVRTGGSGGGHGFPLVRLDLANMALRARDLARLLAHNAALEQLRVEVMDSGAHTFIGGPHVDDQQQQQHESTSSAGKKRETEFVRLLREHRRRHRTNHIAAAAAAATGSSSSSSSSSSQSDTPGANNGDEDVGEDDEELRNLHPMLRSKVLHKRRREAYLRSRRGRGRGTRTTTTASSSSLKTTTRPRLLDSTVARKRMVAVVGSTPQWRGSGSGPRRGMSASMSGSLRLRSLSLDIMLEGPHDSHSMLDIDLTEAPERRWKAARRSFLAIIALCPLLEELRLGAHWQFEVNPDTVKAIAAHCPRLRVLDMAPQTLNMDDPSSSSKWKSPFELWNTALPRLRSFGISQGEARVADVEALCKHPALEELMLPDLGIGTPSILLKRAQTKALRMRLLPPSVPSPEALDDLLKHPIQLRTLVLEFTELGEHALFWEDRHTEMLLNNSVHLENLVLSRVPVSTNTARVLAESSTLKRLVVKNVGAMITNTSAALLFKSTSIHSLALQDSTNITDALIAELGSASVLEATAIRNVNLSQTSVGDTVVSAIMRSSHVRFLALANCPQVTDKTLETLCKENATLQHLVLDDNTGLQTPICHPAVETLSLRIPCEDCTGIESRLVAAQMRLLLKHGRENVLPSLRALFVHRHVFSHLDNSGDALAHVEIFHTRCDQTSSHDPLPPPPLLLDHPWRDNPGICRELSAAFHPHM